MCVNAHTKFYSQCDLILDWYISGDIIHFTLTKANYRLDEWIGIIFSKQPANSDIVIGVIPAADELKVING